MNATAENLETVRYPWRYSLASGTSAALPDKESEQEGRESDEAKVLAALEDPKWDYRTVHGVSKETGVSEEQVKDIFESQTKKVRKIKARNRLGHDLYAPNEKPMSIREFLFSIQSYLSKNM